MDLMSRYNVYELPLGINSMGLVDTLLVTSL
jgi:hypothetical protein